MPKTKPIALILSVLVMSFLVGYLVLAWTEPSVAPPGGNVPAPLRSESSDLNLAGSTWSERNIININALQGYDDLFLKGNSGETAAIYYGGSAHKFYTGGTEKMTILNGGNVGIGTTGPGAKLEINSPTAGDASETLLRNKWNDNWYLDLVQQHVSGSHLQYNWIQRVNGTNYDVLSFKNGNVGIGTTDPGSYKLNVNGNIHGGYAFHMGTDLGFETTENAYINTNSGGTINIGSGVYAGTSNVNIGKNLFVEGHLLVKPKTLFFTKALYDGDLQFFGGGDAVCNNEVPGAIMATENVYANYFSNTNPYRVDRGWIKRTGDAPSNCNNWSTADHAYTAKTAAIAWSAIAVDTDAGGSQCDIPNPVICLWAP